MDAGTAGIGPDQSDLELVGAVYKAEFFSTQSINANRPLAGRQIGALWAQ